MATKLSNLIMFFLLVSFASNAQESSYMKNIKIDSIQLSTGIRNYNDFFHCSIQQQKTELNDETNYVITYITYSCDSLVIIKYDVDSNNQYPYTNFIEIYSEKHTVWLKGTKFIVGMNVSELFEKAPDLKKDYDVYVKENKRNFNRPAYFGIPVIIETNDEAKSYYGALKFNLKKGKVISILVDFRADGDFD